MKIVRDKGRTITIADIPIGECFQFENVYYIMTDGHCSCDNTRTCVVLYSGYLENFNAKTIVTPIDADVVVHES